MPQRVSVLRPPKDFDVTFGMGPNVAATLVDKRKSKVVMMAGIKEAPPVLAAKHSAGLL